MRIPALKIGLKPDPAYEKPFPNIGHKRWARLQIYRYNTYFALLFGHRSATGLTSLGIHLDFLMESNFPELPLRKGK